MPLGQGFLNSWLKVNNKHVVIPNKNEKEGKLDGSKLATRSNIRKPSPETVMTEKTAKSAHEERNQIIRRFSNRKNKRRLNRTVSASDLIREQVSGKGSKKFVEDDFIDSDFASRAPSGASSSSIFGGSGRSQNQIQNQQWQHQDESSSQTPAKPLHDDQTTAASEKNGSLRFVAGFFGADIDTVSVLGNDIENRSAKSGPNGQRDTSVSVMSKGESSLPARIKSKPLGGGIGIRFPPNIFALDSITGEKCQQCCKLEDELALAREDVEYLRGVALRNEYTYSSSGQQQEDKQQVETTSSQSSSLKEAAESTQEAEIEEMKKEWATMQDEMQQEIQKYADVCVKLNEEAEFRTEEAMNLHVELDSVSRERDEMATEVETLRAKVAEYERRDEERRKAEEILQQYEEHGLGFATREIGARDAIIQDLSKRLEFALDTLSMEREKQNQRRHIIFPNQRNQHNSSSDTTAMEQELKATKESLQRAEETIEFLQRQNNIVMERD
mmetsp:Transcript_41973/g.101139  ORF Transcript_41973/g.101139 Transcript_41973/m.101139 type:complete len:500 (+) Transcript_41973:148-1647(+)